jgi:hypothetical protein
MGHVAEASHNLSLDRLGLAADVCGEVPTPRMVELGHLDQLSGFAVGDAIAKLRHQIIREVFKHPSIIAGRADSGQVYTGRRRSPRIAPDGNRHCPEREARQTD